MPGVRAGVEALMPYTQRHFSRMDRLLKTTFTLDYTMKMAKLLQPDGSVPDIDGASVGAKRRKAFTDDEDEEDYIFELNDAKMREWQESRRRRRDEDVDGGRKRTVLPVTDGGVGDDDDDDDDNDIGL